MMVLFDCFSEYYCFLTSPGGDQKSMMSKVAKQLIEMNTKLEFLDSAKKHLEVD